MPGFRNIAFDDAARQPFGDRCLADAGLADQQRVVLASAAQRLDDALQFLSRPISGSILPASAIALRFSVVSSGPACPAVRLRFPSRLRPVLLLRHLADAVRNEVDHVEAGHALLLQVIDGMRILFAEDRDQHVGAVHFLLPDDCMQDGALDDALEAERRLVSISSSPDDGRRVLGDELVEVAAQDVDAGTAGAQGLSG